MRRKTAGGAKMTAETERAFGGALAAPLLALCAALSTFGACAGSPRGGGGGAARKVDAASYAKELEAWKAERLAGLKGEGGWLSLVGLFWLEEGENKLGSDPSNHIELPEGKAPPSAGSLWLRGGAVSLEARPDLGITHEGKPVTSLDLRADTQGAPTVLRLGTLTFQVIERGGKLGLRVKDSENPDRLNFKGLEYFPLSDGWRVEARFERSDPPKAVPIVNVLGMTENQPSPGAVVFEAGGRMHRLEALTEAGADKLFIIFADETTGKETYGAGRYLYADPPGADGKVVVDFNKAFSPPCAFTNYATCPLPPPQNRLAVRVEAGEKHAGH